MHARGRGPSSFLEELSSQLVYEGQVTEYQVRKGRRAELWRVPGPKLFDPVGPQIACWMAERMGLEKRRTQIGVVL